MTIILSIPLPKWNQGNMNERLPVMSRRLFHDRMAVGFAGGPEDIIANMSKMQSQSTSAPIVSLLLPSR